MIKEVVEEEKEEIENENFDIDELA